jgi:plastocyanin
MAVRGGGARWRSFMGLAVLVVGFLAGCSLWGPEGGPGGAGIGAASPSATAAVALATPGADGIQRIEITVGDDLRFIPSHVRAHPGVIELSFRNSGQTPHDVRVAGPATAGTGNVNSGETRSVRLTVDRPGTYPFPCLYHETSGMIGTLEVA